MKLIPIIIKKTNIPWSLVRVSQPVAFEISMIAMRFRLPHKRSRMHNQTLATREELWEGCLGEWKG